ncbi:DUF1800 family protein [Novosphingobium sp. BL-52-GroH]|uniref:DUF1800 domain-containing protein n=1 Tax=Novosphingobium sp. BL-52-GroH TaxID=3349877 RepID=UPI00384B2BC8
MQDTISAAPEIPQDHSTVSTASLVPMFAFALSACGGGEGSSPTPTPSPTAVPTLPIGIEQQRASRFLCQATNGATRAEIDAFVQIGMGAWLDNQFAQPRGQSHWDWMIEQSFNTIENKYNKSHWNFSVWRQTVSGLDQMRQKISLALLDIFVVSINDIIVGWPQFALANYMDILLDHAFGNFRTLLSAVTYSTAMGEYLTYVGSRKQNSSGNVPDENYAREMMQLFTIGLYELNPDGTKKLGPDGQAIATYNATDVSQLSRIFTGFSFPSSDLSTPDFRQKPLIIDAATNETGETTFLGAKVTGGGKVAVEAALDVLFQHPNVAPFFAKNLIQRLVTSNPSPAYVSRAAAAFENDGNGKRGELKAVIRAILTDAEARSDDAAQSDSFGLLRSPVQRLSGVLRAFRATSAAGSWKMEDLRAIIGQSPGTSPSVFNFFQPAYSPPGSEFYNRGLVAPEFQITDEVSTIGYANTVRKAVRSGLASGDIKLDLSDLVVLAPDPAALVDEVSIRIAAGRIPAGIAAKIASSVSAISSTSASGLQSRAQVGVLLCAVSPDCMVQK